MRDSTKRSFEAYGKLLDTVSDFKYLVRVMKAVDDNWPAVAGNLSKAWNRWRRQSRILCREGAEAMVLGNFFKAVVQAALIFGAAMIHDEVFDARKLDSKCQG